MSVHTCTSHPPTRATTHSPTCLLQVHGKAESISLHNIFGFLRGGFLWAKATNSIANVCDAETGQVCTGFLEHEGDAHLKRLQSPIASSLLQFETVKHWSDNA